MLGYDPTGERGIDRLMPDQIRVLEPKEDPVLQPGAQALAVEAEVVGDAAPETQAPVEPEVQQDQQAYAYGAGAQQEADW